MPSLNTEKPDNPIGFIVEYLQKKYPDQAGPAVSAAEPTAASAPVEDDDAESEEEEDDDDYVGEMDDNDAPPPVVNRGQRRVSVCAESPSESMSTHQTKVIPKNAEETARILEILKKNVLFKHLDSDQMDTVKDAMFLVNHKTGDEIIKQGDDGDNFYVMDSGSVEVFVKGVNDDKSVLEYGDGDSFGGEFELLAVDLCISSFFFVCSFRLSLVGRSLSLTILCSPLPLNLSLLHRTRHHVQCPACCDLQGDL